jgi:excisionase family DNA binding protein
MEQLALPVSEAAKAGGPKRAKLYEEINKGRLRAIKMGRSTRILVDDLRKYLAALPAIEPKVPAPPASDPPRPPRRRRRSSTK